MKTTFTLLTIIWISLNTNAQTQTASSVKRIQNEWKGNNPSTVSDADWLNQAQAFISKGEYSFKNLSSSTFISANRAQKLQYKISAKGYSAQPLSLSFNDVAKSWSTSFELVSIGKQAAGFTPSLQPVTEVKGDYILQHHHSFNIEYTNNEQGLRQNFIINQQPAGNENLKVSLAIKNNHLAVSLVNNQVVKLVNASGKTILQYDELKVWDANKKSLNAHMEMSSKKTLDIIVDDKNAVYPVTVDPLSHSAEWSATAQGILPSVLGQLAVDAAFGYSVAGLGDINGDGYDDVAVGAPGLVDVISGTGTLVSVGAVFVYYGSNSGLPVTPSAKLQPTTAVAGALFGFSIAAGDITGDGKNDVLVGAPLDKVTLSIGLGQTASGTVGKVYAFNGATLSATTTPFLTLQLSGAGILANGVNLSVNALFGYSVAVTEDLNGDNKKDIIVGSPAYAGIKLGIFKDVQSGAAFVFQSNGAAYDIKKLNPPSNSLLGLGILSTNISGLLFGISVDGAGDYNNDTHPDVVVGAAAGIDLGSLTSLLTGNLLQGSASVYYSNGTTISTTAGATLEAASGGLLTNLTGTLSNIANLFGYCVKGVKNASGVRTGNILVGAPLGGVLTNLLGGLQVKTGTVSVFKQTTGATGVITPDQQLSSPRNNNTVLGLIQTSLLFGFSIDNAYDVNCDGIADIVVGEPASSGAQLIAANVAGGSAYVFLGKADGTYQSGPAWSLGATYDATLGVNVASLIGYSVAGARRVRGLANNNKILIGAPGRSLDFGTGLLNLGNTLGTIFGLAAGNNGVGKAYLFDTQLCGTTSTLPLLITQFNAILQPNKQVLVSWEVSTEKNINSYIVERSTNGINWETFALVPGSPNSDDKQDYAITDKHPYSGISYYRIKQTNIDNEYFYSIIRVVSLTDGINQNVIVNNPFNSFVTIQFHSQTEGNNAVELMDINGRVISRQAGHSTIGANIIQINNLSSLPKGMYIVHMINGNDVSTTKLIKE